MNTDNSRNRFAPVGCVFIGGVLGTSIRAAFSFLQPTDTAWPYVTFIVNLCGAFILGLLLEYLSITGKDEGGRKLFRLFAGTGIMGGFTTYGTFILEVDTRFEGHQIWLAVAYAVVSVVCGVALAGLGVVAANRIANSRADRYARAHHLPALSEDFGAADLDAPDALNDPGNLEKSVSEPGPEPGSASEPSPTSERKEGGAR
jgi:CrcB protein